MRHPAIYRIDDKVVFTMLTISVVCLLLMAFRYKNREVCGDVRFDYRTANKNEVAFTNEAVFFTSIAGDANTSEWAWNFGDKSPVDRSSGPTVQHAYKQPGTYRVELTINGTCQGTRLININNRETAGKKLWMRVSWPAEPLYTGREYYFIDSTAGAETWSWYFDNEPRRSRQAMAYQFMEPGQHTVTLVVNEDMANNKIERVFTVLRAQEPRSTVPGRQSPVSGGGGPARTINDQTDSPSLTDYFKDSADKGRTKAPMISDNGLRIAVLDINGKGTYDIRKYLRNNNFSNCTIVFNDHILTLDQLQANIKEHQKNGKSLTVTQETDANGNLDKIMIAAELKPKNGVFGIGSKERKYPY